MKKLLIGLAIGSVIALGANSLYAWGGSGNGCCGGNNTEKNGQGYMMGYGMHGYGHLVFLKEKAGLSDDQIDKIIKIDSDYSSKFFKNRDNADKISSLRAEHKKAVESVLTADQKKKLDEFSKDRDGRKYGFCPWR